MRINSREIKKVNGSTVCPLFCAEIKLHGMRIAKMRKCGNTLLLPLEGAEQGKLTSHHLLRTSHFCFSHFAFLISQFSGSRLRFRQSRQNSSITSQHRDLPISTLLSLIMNNLGKIIQPCQKKRLHLANKETPYYLFIFIYIIYYLPPEVMLTVDLSKKLTFHNITTAHMQPTLQNLLKTYTLEQLKEKCRTCGLKVSGSTAEHALRFREYQESIERQHGLCASISTSTPDSADNALARLLPSAYGLVRAASAPNVLMTNHNARLCTQKPVASMSTTTTTTTTTTTMEPVFSRDFVIMPNLNKRATSDTSEPTLPVDKKQRCKQEFYSSSSSSSCSSCSDHNSEPQIDHLLSSCWRKHGRCFCSRDSSPRILSALFSNCFVLLLYVTI